MTMVQLCCLDHVHGFKIVDLAWSVCIWAPDKTNLGAELLQQAIDILDAFF